MKTLHFLVLASFLLSACGPDAEVPAEPGRLDVTELAEPGIQVTNGIFYGHDEDAPFALEADTYRVTNGENSFLVDLINQQEGAVMVRLLDLEWVSLTDVANGTVEETKVKALYCKGNILDAWNYDAVTYDGYIRRVETETTTRVVFELPFSEFEAPVYGAFDLEGSE